MLMQLRNLKMFDRDNWQKYKAQGYNDFTVFSTQAAAALSAGFFLNITSWQTLNLICLPFLAIIVLTIWRADRMEI